ncbi:MAG: GNAT family N-acetyltransferase [Cyanothece sp. SIO1E1]|nr:GNAT family N-acetyltransferase [Cyanothece sp. SIO1E1]
MIKEATIADLDAWIELRIQLWPQCSNEECQSDCLKIVESNRETCFISYLSPDEKQGIGFIEVSTRDYVEGCRSSPVGYIEGIFVSKGYRKRGLGTTLIEKSYEWLLSKGCSEVGSDSLIDNETSISFHKQIGFEEIERHVVFKKAIPAQSDSKGY